MESEFIALATMGQETEWLRNRLPAIKLRPQPMPSIYLHYDSEITISKTYSKIYDRKSIHISLRHENVR